ncbi:glycosyltransferase family 2 protein [Methylorubrum sp. SB2]|uniref:glycosyltransferase family 2 protein n=1 Tax=Methylorubrum subtropicum TaxID=3138812 RepID=UPI00313D2C5B
MRALTDTAPMAPARTDAPDLSFVMAAYNAAPWIEAALASALDQRGVGVEIVVVDDASTDDTASRVAALAARDPRVVLIRRARGGGPSAARNLAIERARGAWIAILDADDAVAPERARHLIALAERTGCAVAADNVACFPDAEPERSWPLVPDLAEDAELRVGLAEYLNRNRMMGGRSNLGFLKPIFSRAFLARHGIRYDESVRIGEDFLICLRCLMAGTDMAVSGRAGYRYRMVSTSLSRKLKAADLDTMRTTYDALGLTPSEPAAVRADAAYRGSLAEMRAYIGLREGMSRRDVGAVLRHALQPACWRAVARLALRKLRRR